MIKIYENPDNTYTLFTGEVVIGSEFVSELDAVNFLKERLEIEEAKAKLQKETLPIIQVLELGDEFTMASRIRETPYVCLFQLNNKVHYPEDEYETKSMIAGKCYEVGTCDLSEVTPTGTKRNLTHE